MKYFYALCRVIAAILREISDASAYQRHLLASGRPHSPDEWRRFWDGRLQRKFQRARCC